MTPPSEPYLRQRLSAQRTGVQPRAPEGGRAAADRRRPSAATASWAAARTTFKANGSPLAAPCWCWRRGRSWCDGRDIVVGQGCDEVHGDGRLVVRKSSA